MSASLKYLSLAAFLFVAVPVACRSSGESSPTPDPSASAAPSASQSVIDDGGQCIESCAVADPKLTPGRLCTAKDLDFDGLRYPEKVPVCRAAVTAKMKDAVLGSYGPQSEEVVIDHLVPLSLGGANDPANLWPQPVSSVKEKDALEERLTTDVKEGKLTVAEAIAQVKAWKPTSCR